jgi:hypothetical protein
VQSSLSNSGLKSDTFFSSTLKFKPSHTCYRTAMMLKLHTLRALSFGKMVVKFQIYRYNVALCIPTSCELSLLQKRQVFQNYALGSVTTVHKNCSKVAEQMAMSDVFWALIETAKQRQMLQNLRWHSNRHICNVLQISKTRLQQLYALEGLQKCIAVAKSYLSHLHMILWKN